MPCMMFHQNTWISSYSKPLKKYWRNIHSSLSSVVYLAHRLNPLSFSCEWSSHVTNPPITSATRFSIWLWDSLFCCNVLAFAVRFFVSCEVLYFAVTLLLPWHFWATIRLLTGHWHNSHLSTVEFSISSTHLLSSTICTSHCLWLSYLYMASSI